tara:strand:- start:376 stop:921 length:546 start_codon:yes stop_codon:yes gene_type:complete
MNYTKEDFNGGDGMLTYIWGPPLWHFLHTMSFNYPVNPTEEQKDDYSNFLLSLGKILPCIHCRDNFQKNLKNIRFSDNDFDSRDTFSRAIFDLHNEVNKSLDKEGDKNYDDIKWQYEHFRARCSLEDLRKKEKKKKKGKEKEKGCVEPMNKKIPKHKCQIEIIPLTDENNENSICFDKCEF